MPRFFLMLLSLRSGISLSAELKTGSEVKWNPSCRISTRILLCSTGKDVFLCQSKNLRACNFFPDIIKGCYEHRFPLICNIFPCKFPERICELCLSGWSLSRYFTLLRYYKVFPYFIEIHELIAVPSWDLALDSSRFIMSKQCNFWTFNWILEAFN